MNFVEVIGRMMLALGVVLAIMWVIAKWVRKPLTGKSDRVMTVLARQQLSRGASVAVVKISDRALVLGVTEQSVQLLTETDLSIIEETITVIESQPSRRRGRQLTADSRNSENPRTDEDFAVVLEAATTAAPDGSISTGGTAIVRPGRPLEVRTSHRAGRSRSTARTEAKKRAAPADANRTGGLDGSILSPKVWKQLTHSVREMTVRR